MSMHDITTIKCQECGKEYEFEYYRSINVSLEPELKEKVISGEIFKTICPECGKIDYMLFPFLYHDMEKGYMIMVSKKDEVEEMVKLHKQEQKMIDDEFPGMPQEEIHGVALEEYEKLETIVLSYDNGYDPFLVDIYLDLEKDSVAEMLKDVKGFTKVYKAYLHMIDGVLKVVFELDEKGYGFNVDFEIEKYNIIKEEMDKFLAAKEAEKDEQN